LELVSVVELGLVGFVLGFCCCRGYGLAYSVDALFMSGSPTLNLSFGFVFSVLLGCSVGAAVVSLCVGLAIV